MTDLVNLRNDPPVPAVIRDHYVSVVSPYLIGVPVARILSFVSLLIFCGIPAQSMDRLRTHRLFGLFVARGGL